MAAFFFQLKLFTKRFFWGLFFLEISRLYFFIRNFNHFRSLHFSEVLISFFHGIQFDYYSLITIGSLFVVFSFLPFKCFFSKNYQQIIKWLFVISVSLILLLNFIDAEYFKFTGKRSTCDILSMVTTGDDTIHMLPQFLKDFWFGVVILSFLIFLLVKFYPDMKFKTEIPQLKIIPNIFFSIFSFFVFLLLARGFGIRPVTIVDAAEENPFSIPLTLNTSFTILQTMNQDNLQPLNYLSTTEAARLFSPIRQFRLTQPFEKKNVIILILESFGKEYVGFYNNYRGYTPFLDSLFQRSLTFHYSLADGKKSVEGIPAIIASIPNLNNNPFIFSPFVSNQFNSLASILGDEGYQTAFFHGGKNGTMGFDLFAKAAGFQTYFGKNEYPNPKDYDGNWGIYDEPYLQYIAKKLNTFKQPFFITEFTLSSHHPYQLPIKYKGRFPEGTLPIHRVIAYSDYALKRFFETAQKQPWYKNTLFVLVADHTSISEKPFFQNPLGTFEITMAYFAPGDLLLYGKKNIVTQQIDIMPSILNYLHYPKPFFAFGKSIFDKKSSHFAVTYLNNLYEMTTPNQFLLFDGDNIKGVYKLPEDSLLQHNLFSPDKHYPGLDTLKAFLQIYSHALIDNKMLPLSYGEK